MRFLLPLLCAAVLSAQNHPHRSDWIRLFNGKTLDGWTPKIAKHELGENYANTFRVENGLLKVAYDQYPAFENQFGHLFYKDRFSHYLLAIEYRFVGEQARGGPGWALRNSGVMIHSQDPRTMTREQDFPISIEVQFLGGTGTGPRSTANLCTPGTHVVYEGTLHTQHCTASKSKTYDGDQWVRVEVEVLGGQTIRHLIDGETVLSYEQPQIGGGVVNNVNPTAKQDGALLREGYLALQAESHPIEFRKVELLNLSGCLDPKARNYRSWYKHADHTRCRY